MNRRTHRVFLKENALSSEFYKIFVSIETKNLNLFHTCTVFLNIGRFLNFFIELRIIFTLKIFQTGNHRYHHDEVIDQHKQWLRAGYIVIQFFKGIM